MKLTKGFWARIIPALIMVIVTAVMSVVVYQRMIEVERETCWERLEIATKSTAGKIEVRITDNLNFLDAVSDSFVLTHHLDNTAEVGKYLNAVMEMTIFERINVVLPDGSIVTQDGEIIQLDGDLNYAELLDKGTHISPRRTCPFTGKEVIYCFTVIDLAGEPIGLLCGTIACETMGEVFEVFTYGDAAQIFLIDCTDGNYLIDTWHAEFGNIHNIGLRESIDGEKDVDMVPAILNREDGRVAFVSETNQEHSYQYYTPVNSFNWELCVAVQEDVVFAHAKELEEILFTIGIGESVLLVFYLTWNIWVSINATKNEEKARKLELERATNAAKAKFISNMSHDVRTPLNGIVGMLHVIKIHRDDQTFVDECLEKIGVSTQYLATLTSDMLDINEIESSNFTLEQEPIDLHKLADELHTVIEQKAKDANVKYSMDYSQLKNPYVLGSAVHIKRIMVNLVSNAIRYSRDEGGEVKVSIVDEQESAERGLYKFIVSDNGIGMTEEFQRNMYDAFAQEKNSARSSYQGYGLGLTIVSHLVGKMGGSIELESKKGEGSIFTVTLPLEISWTAMQITEKVAEFVDLKGVKVLLVEDNELNMEIADILLRDAGATVTQAVNGKIATEIFAEAPENAFDLILMDIMMPEMDGYEATRVIRAMDRTDAKEIPIIAMTASAFTEEISKCKEVGMNEHIAKPLNVDLVLQKVAQYSNI